MYAELARQHPEFAEMQVNQSALEAYRDLDGVPESLSRTAQAPASQEAADDLRSALSAGREGYAATRYGSAEDAAHHAEPAFVEGQNVFYHYDSGSWIPVTVCNVDATITPARYTVKVDGDNGSVRFYVDGKRLSASAAQQPAAETAAASGQHIITTKFIHFFFTLLYIHSPALYFDLCK